MISKLHKSLSGLSHLGTEEATEMAAKYLHNKKNVFLITLKNIAHYYYNDFEEYIYIYIYMYIHTEHQHT